MDPILILVALLGLCLGSFWNVVISRVPSPDRSLMRPMRSACPACGHTLSGWENVPVLSYLVLAGRCRECRESISLVYPTVEIAVATVVVGAYVAFPDAPLLAVRYTLFLLLLLAIAVTDARTYMIPDLYTVGGALAGVLLAGLAAGVPEGARALGDGLVAGASLWLFGRVMERLVGREALGFGDVLLIGMMATFLGFGPALIALWLATIPAIALYALHHRGAHEEGHIPLGLHMALGAALVTVALHFAPIGAPSDYLAWYGELLNGLLPWY